VAPTTTKDVKKTNLQIMVEYLFLELKTTNILELLKTLLKYVNNSRKYSSRRKLHIRRLKLVKVSL
jgi:hypothetical protein